MPRFLMRFAWLMGIAGTLLSVRPIAAQDDAQLRKIAADAYDVFSNHCYSCHGAQIKFPGLYILEQDSLIADRGEDLDRYVEPGKPEESEVWYRAVSIGDMPPSGPLSDEEKDKIVKWIEAGAPKLAPISNRDFISEEEILKSISQYLFNEVRKEDAPKVRFFSIAHLHNNPTVPAKHLRLYRAALSKVINSMSQGSRIVVPKAIDQNNAVFAVFLPDLRWDVLGEWDKVVKAYPYGLKPSDTDARDEYDKIEELQGAFFDGIAYIKADWFIVEASKPPLYYDLVGVPETLQELEEELGIEFEDDFRENRLVRAGMFESGVSTQNRLVERRESLGGKMYWISYDFKGDAGRSNLARFPLGPEFEGNPFNNAAFEHDGGEVIWELPNGMHAYMLALADGKRIDAGPVDIVFDPSGTSGSPLIVNGLSCMNCHEHGTIPLKDDIREGHALANNDAEKKVRELYPPKETMDRLLREDRDNYLRALTKAMGPFLLVEEDEMNEDGSKKKIDDSSFPEPVSFVAKRYEKNVTLDVAVAELGLNDGEDLRRLLFSKRLVQLGLAPLARQNGSIKRGYWDTDDTSNSVFQEVASELRVGTPVN